MARGPSQWKLPFAVALSLAACVASAVLFGICVLVFSVTLESSAEVLLTDSLRFANICLAAAGASSYLHVSSRAPRARQLHAHGLVLMLTLPADTMVMPGMMLIRRRMFLSGWSLVAAATTLFGIRKCLFFTLLAEKLAVLGPQTRCGKVRIWVYIVAVSLIAAVCAGLAILLISVALRALGEDVEDAQSAISLSDAEGWVVGPVLQFLLYFGAGMLASFCMASCGLMLVTWQLLSSTASKLAGREVTATMLSKVQRTMHQHFLGLLVGFVCSFLRLITTALDHFNAFGHEGTEDLGNVIAGVLDKLGDISGILLLSGIGLLLFKEDPEAGDINGHIRSLLRATVLTSRADNAFQGRVVRTPSNLCVVSFPGKYMEEWNMLTWLCEQRELSSACVFLPVSDPMKRFGMHAPSPELFGKCWCSGLYGEEKPWGCLWFTDWLANVKKAIELGLDLVVVFFPGQAGKGSVDWDDLPTADLWNGVGLGGSQKAELAYLKRMKVSVIEMDLIAARQNLLGVSGRASSSLAPTPSDFGSVTSVFSLGSRMGRTLSLPRPSHPGHHSPGPASLRVSTPMTPALSVSPRPSSGHLSSTVASGRGIVTPAITEDPEGADESM